MTPRLAFAFLGIAAAVLLIAWGVCSWLDAASAPVLAGVGSR